MPARNRARHRQLRWQWWAEKAAIALFACQLFALLWVFARPLPWPQGWRIRSSWTVWFNLDAVGAATIDEDATIIPELRGSVYGSLPRYWMLVVVWAAVPLVALSMRDWLPLLARLCGVQLNLSFTTATEDVLLVLATALQLPASLALSRVYACERHPLYPGLRMAAQPDMECWTFPHLILAALVAPSTLAFLVYLPYRLLKHIRQLLVFRHKHDHERFLRWKECEYAHSLSEDWALNRMWTFSSFRRTLGHSFDLPLWQLTMSVLVVTLTVARQRPSVCADVMFAALCLWSLRHLYAPTFRNWSSNAMWGVCLVALTAVSFWSLLRGHGMLSSVTVDSNFHLSLLVITATAASACALILIVAVVTGDDLPRGYITSPNAVRDASNRAKGSSDSSGAGTVPTSLVVMREGSEANLHRDETELIHGSEQRPALLHRLFQRKNNRVAPAPAADSAAAAPAPETGPAAAPVQQPEESSTAATITIRAPREPGAENSQPTVSSSSTKVDEKGMQKQGGGVPLTTAEVAALEVQWIRAVQEARQLLADSRILPAQLVNVPRLHTQAEVLRACIRDATVCRHVLSWSLQDALDSVWSNYLVHLPVSLFPNPELEQLLRVLAQRSREREEHYALAGRVRSRLILKLLALRAFVGSRAIPRLWLPGANDHAVQRSLGIKAPQDSPASNAAALPAGMDPHLSQLLSSSADEVALFGITSCTDLSSAFTAVLEALQDDAQRQAMMQERADVLRALVARWREVLAKYGLESTHVDGVLRLQLGSGSISGALKPTHLEAFGKAAGMIGQRVEFKAQ